MKLLALLATVCFALSAEARTWKDATGHFRVEAEIIGFRDETVILKKLDGDLMAIAIAELSKDDQDFVRSKDMASKLGQSAEEMQTWTGTDGLRVRGKILAYGRQELKIQRINAHIHFNDRKFSSIDPLHQQLLLKIVSKMEGRPLANESDLVKWGKDLGGAPRVLTLDGVRMRLESGDELNVPFFLFASHEQDLLRPGWQRWLDEKSTHEQKEAQNSMMRSQVLAYQADRAAQKQVEQVKLELLAAATGIISIWKVKIVPPLGGYPMSVIVPAENSQIATNMALQKYPGYVLVGVARASF